MPLGNETIERKTQLQERLERNERIDRKTQLLEQLDPEREVELERTFTNHVADAIGASSPRGELQQEIDNATEAYEDALDGVLNEILDEHLVAALRQPWVGPITKPQSTTPLIGPGHPTLFTELRGIGILRTSPFGHCAKFAKKVVINTAIE
jgi:hypothetical protein